MKPILDTDTILVVSRPVGPFAMNTYLVGCPKTGEAALIDAGGGAHLTRDVLQARDLTLERILQTHAHIDHVLGLPDHRAVYPEIPIHLHPADRPLYENVGQQAALFGLDAQALPPVDAWIADGETFEVGELELTALFTPGHAPGHVCFLCTSEGLLFGGDLIFVGSIGRLDLPGSSVTQMQQSLARVMELDDAIRILPGHMGTTTIGRERASNPLIRQLLAA